MRRNARLAASAAILILAGAAGPAAAARWIEVGAATNGVKLFIDADSLAVKDGWVRLTQRFIFPGNGSHALSRVDQQVAYGCASRTVRTLTSAEYDRAGRASRIDRAGAIAPYRISPTTLPQYVFDLVC
jgi:hypothetical protein